MKKSMFGIIGDQYTRVPPVSTTDLSTQTVIVVGANTGLGFEAAKHFARMNPGRLVLACRSKEKGAAAAYKIREETRCQTVELQLLDLSKFSSVIAFADNFLRDGSRLDLLVANAAVSTMNYKTTDDGWEESLQVNNLSTSLLCLLLAPRMVETAQKFGGRPRIVVVASEVHYLTSLDDAQVIDATSSFQVLSSKEFCTPRKMSVRYLDTKLLNVFFTRSLASLLKDTPVVVNSVNPGFCYSDLARELTGIGLVFMWIIRKIFARTAEEGGRQLVYAAVGSSEDPGHLEGAYVNLHKVDEPSDYVLGDEGMRRQNKLWADLVRELSKVDGRIPSIVRDLGSQSQ
ncbi:hypothetical protein EST38_g7258 [Candolleomyces aberdarensis]|uniref:Short-chain dehydrogenase/reductase n=1 Tax=Candolleomyces aberdarensis TaxID=2316362 RepID=A0A4Q2DFP4_9AGAR|nr:hypothetical protein EST38_g7258 [Candolleomyces aberdarensis]